MKKYAPRTRVYVLNSTDGFIVADATDTVVRELVALDATCPELLDFSVGTDEDTELAEFELTVEAASVPDAIAFRLSTLRSAIHSSGGATHGWDDTTPEDEVTAFELDEVNGSPLALT